MYEIVNMWLQVVQGSIVMTIWLQHECTQEHFIHIGYSNISIDKCIWYLQLEELSSTEYFE